MGGHQCRELAPNPCSDRDRSAGQVSDATATVVAREQRLIIGNGPPQRGVHSRQPLALTIGILERVHVSVETGTGSAFLPIRKPDAPEVPFRVSSLTFNDGTQVETGDADIVVIVGPNNIGKTRTLQEMEQFLRQPSVDPATLFALRDVSTSRLMSSYQVEQWFTEHRPTWPDPSNPGRKITYSLNGAYGSNSSGQLQLTTVIQSWDALRVGPSLDQFYPHLVQTLYVIHRLAGMPGAQRPEFGQNPEHPFHVLIDDDALLGSFSEAFALAFGMNIIMDGWGRDIRIRVSSDQTQEDFRSTTVNGLISDSNLANRIARIPLLDTQSDGVRSFTGILLNLLVGQFPLVLIDEPEAFLHPPQARLLGQHLAEWHGHGQVFVATHSLDVLLGLIERKPEKVLIIRLTRGPNGVSPHVLPSARLAEISNDSLLRFSRILDGLFHQGVVVCEGDTDSQFYSLVANRHRAHPWLITSDVMFTPGGGKQRISGIAKSLTALGVPVRMVVDFDAINDSGILKALVESVGADYPADWERDRRVIDANIRGSESPLKAGRLREAINDILGDDSDKLVSRHDIGEIRKAIQPSGGWQAAKQRGKSAVPSGEAIVAADRLLGNLAGVGVHVVPSGAVESFVRAVGGKSGEWIAGVVEGNFISSATEAHNFVDFLLESMLQSSRGAQVGRHCGTSSLGTVLSALVTR